MSEELREKAKEATPGPWRPYHAGLVLRADGAQVGHAEFAHDAAFIAAANPSVILSLLAERDRLLAANEGMRKALEEIRDRNQEREFIGSDRSDGYGDEGWVTRDGQYAKIARAVLSTLKEEDAR